MGFELTPRERRWFDAILVLGALALGFIVLGFVGVDLRLLRRPDHGLLPGLAAGVHARAGGQAVTAIPFMSRTGAIFTVYLILFGGLVVITIVVAAALFARSRTSSATCRRCARTCPRSSRRGRSA